MEGDIGSDGNSETRCPKIVSFSINDITGDGYSMQLTAENDDETDDKLIGTQTTRSNPGNDNSNNNSKHLKFVSFPSTIDQIILSNLQLRSE